MDHAVPSEPAPRNLFREGLEAMPFIAVHILAVVGLFVFDVTPALIALAVGLFVIRMFGVTAGYHRYFSHRAYKTGRVFQFVLAFLAQSSSQKSALWWAAHHRVHHKHSDTALDVHSPLQRGFFYSHVGWLFDPVTVKTHYDKIRDFTSYPELMFLDRFWVLPPVLLGVACWLLFSWPGLFIGFFLSTVVLWHSTFFINSLAHVFGKRRFATTDDSRNSLPLALLTLGEGWHNNHHHYQSSARNGFYWWEIDLTYYGLVVLSWFGLVWDLRPVPERVLEEGRRIDAERRRGVEPPPFVPEIEAAE